MCFSLLSHQDDHIWLQASEDLTDKSLAPQLSKCHAGCVLSVVFTLHQHHQVQSWFICYWEMPNIHHMFVFFKDQVIPEGQQLSGFVFLPLFKFKIMLHQKSDPTLLLPYNCACHSVCVWHYMVVCARLLQACFHLLAWRSVLKITPAIFAGDLSAAAWLARRGSNAHLRCVS